MIISCPGNPVVPAPPTKIEDIPAMTPFEGDLTALNDDDNASFKDIAERIERELAKQANKETPKHD